MIIHPAPEYAAALGDVELSLDLGIEPGIEYAFAQLFVSNRMELDGHKAKFDTRRIQLQSDDQRPQLADAGYRLGDLGRRI